MKQLLRLNPLADVADNAQQASTLAQETSKAAATGTEAMRRMSTAINDIQRSSDETAGKPTSVTTTPAIPRSAASSGPAASTSFLSCSTFSKAT